MQCVPSEVCSLPSRTSASSSLPSFPRQRQRDDVVASGRRRRFESFLLTTHRPHREWSSQEVALVGCSSASAGCGGSGALKSIVPAISSNRHGRAFTSAFAFPDARLNLPPQLWTVYADPPEHREHLSELNAVPHVQTLQPPPGWQIVASVPSSVARFDNALPSGLPQPPWSGPSDAFGHQGRLPVELGPWRLEIAGDGSSSSSSAGAHGNSGGANPRADHTAGSAATADHAHEQRLRHLHHEDGLVSPLVTVLVVFTSTLLALRLIRELIVAELRERREEAILGGELADGVRGPGIPPGFVSWQGPGARSFRPFGGQSYRLEQEGQPKNPERGAPRQPDTSTIAAGALSNTGVGSSSAREATDAVGSSRPPQAMASQLEGERAAMRPAADETQDSRSVVDPMPATPDPETERGD